MFSISIYNLAFALPKMDWEDSGSFTLMVIKFSLLCSDGCTCLQRPRGLGEVQPNQFAWVGVPGWPKVRVSLLRSA